MKQTEIEKVIEIYKLYGFDVAEIESDLLVFTFSNGYFFNCEIMVGMDNDDGALMYKEKYEDIGYSTRIIHFISIKDVQKRLYAGFFNVDVNKNKRIVEYNRFIENQNVKLFGGEKKYSYVAGEFVFENVTHNNNIVDEIFRIFNNTGPQLILVEAAAGFGKTCTSYEVMKRLSEAEGECVPIFIELSKNRNAKVFRHVLLDAIDNNFSYLSSDVVKFEIKNGRIPLIIDGFDELLSKSVSEKKYNKITSEDKSDAQNMLSTIAELLEAGSNARIMLTSRKTSLFTGEDFDEWTLQELNECEVSRLMMEEPTLVNWLGNEKVKYINEKRIPLQQISNPIILSIYRNMEMDEFLQKCNSTDTVLNEYFNSIMRREKTRQSLVLDEREQYMVFLKFASVLAEFDISAADPVFIKEVFEMILCDDMPEYLHRYDLNVYNEERPNEETFIQKLVHHAFLDRKSQNIQIIGFLNDFIFGNFIAEAILGEQLDPSKVNSKYIELAATSFAVKRETAREELYKKIESMIQQLDVSERIVIDMNLKGKSVGKYEDGLIGFETFSDRFQFDASSRFVNVCFSQCIFNEVELHNSIFDNCQFVNCQFYNCNLVKDDQKQNSMQFIACNGIDEWKDITEKETSDGRDYEKIVLEQYWRPGRANADPRHTYRTLLKGLATEEYVFVDEAISNLKNRGILTTKGPYLALNMKMMNEIRDTLGR